MSDERKYLSIIIPFHNEEGNLMMLNDELIKTLNCIDKSFEIILIDDGSKDNSLYIAKKIAKKHKEITCIELSRNFGQENAILAGMEHSCGDLIISMDADLQHPPNLVLEMIAKYEEGYDVVNTTRRDKQNNLLKIASIKLFYKILNILSGTDIKISSLNFKLISRNFLNEFIQLKEVNRFDRGLIEWLGFKQCYIEYQAEMRYSGRSKYTFIKLVIRGLNSISNFSTKPLHFIFHTSIIVFMLSLISISIVFFRHMLGKDEYSSLSLILAIFLFGLQYLSIGIVCEYLANIYNETKKRPNYIIKNIIKN